MSMKTDTISCPNASRDIAIDLTKHLEDSEIVTGTPTAVSSDTDILNASSIIANTAIIVKEDNKKIEIGKGVQLSIATTVATVYATFSDFPATGVAGVWYYASETDSMYTWDTTGLEYDIVVLPKTVTVYVWFGGTSGTADRYKITVPIKSSLEK